MRRVFRVLLISGAVTIAIAPVVAATNGELLPVLTFNVVAGLNLVGWSLFLAVRLGHMELEDKVRRAGNELGVSRLHGSLEVILERVVRALERKNEAVRIDLVERRIANEKELSRTLQRVATLCFNLLEAESAELALFDTDSGLYHSSFVLGKPFRSSAQAMLSGAAKGEVGEVSPDVLIQPLAFSGTVLGSLRVALRKGRLPTTSDREILRLLALQASIALINCQYNEELLRLKRAADESVRAKTGFLANLSHEIRGPLGLMLNAVELVADELCGPLNSEQRESLAIVRENGAHLLELVNDVLDYARVESGKVTPDFSDVLLDDILKSLMGVVRAQAEAKKHTLRYRAPTEAQAVRCDRRHLRQMIINLLTNAIKYTPDGGTIEVWSERIAGGRIKVNVKDSGVGIDEADRHKVFEAFERLSQSYSLSQVGTGLGMSLTKRLAEVNGGTVDFISTPGQGSHFWLIFTAADPHAALHPEDVEQRRVEGQGQEILMVQLETPEENLVRRYLENVGFRVRAIDSRVEALRSAGERAPKLVIIDNSLLDKPNDNFIAKIRSQREGATLPVIVLTSRAFVYDVEKYLSAGADRCLIKPVPLGELARICRELIDENEALREASELPDRDLHQSDAQIRVSRTPKIVLPEDLIH